MAAKKKVTDDQPTNDDAARVVVNNVNHADAGGVSAPLHGGFVRVVSGDEAGRYGVLEQTVTVNADGFPDDVLIRTRDDDSILLTVKYSDLTRSEPGGR